MRRLSDAPDEYSRELEQIFRGELRRILMDLESKTAHISVGTDTSTSLYSKKAMRIAPAIGVVSHQ